MTTIQAITQLYDCRQELNRAAAEKSSLEADVARLSEECTEGAARLHVTEVVQSHLFFLHIKLGTSGGDEYFVVNLTLVFK